MLYTLSHILLLIGALIALGAQACVSMSYSKWSRVQSSSGLTGAEVARRILDENGAQSVSIEVIPGKLTDHYDPQNGVLRLSEAVAYSSSIAALGVAAHEAGHAIQDAEDYAPLRTRTSFAPVAEIGSYAAIPLFMLGSLISLPILSEIGIVCFTLAVIFYLVTLPVEANASSRAVAVLSAGYLPEEEMKGVRSMLLAAMMTYIAAALEAVLQLLRAMLLYSGRRNRR